jgi:hypothetical protein
MVFIPRFTLTGAPPLVRAYAIVAAQEWDVYDLVKLDAAGALQELGASNEDVLGAGLGNVGNSTTGQSDADELRSYLAALTTGKHEPVAIFTRTTVFETDDYGSVGTAAVADIGEVTDLELVSSVDWGINNGTSGTGTTPQFRTLDIERTRGTYLVVPDPIKVSGVFQFFDASI